MEGFGVMTGADLKRCAEALYGDDWEGPLLRALDVNERTLRRWLRAEFVLPPTLRQQIEDMLRARHRLIRDCLQDLASA